MGITHFSGLAVGPSSNTDTQAGVVSILKHTVQFTEPALAASAGGVSTHTVAGATTNATYFFSPLDALSTGYAISAVRCSTVNEVSIEWVNANASTNSGSTNRGTLVQMDFSTRTRQ